MIESKHTGEQVELRCTECGTETIVELPSRVDVVSALVRNFEEVHRWCGVAGVR